MQNCARVMLVRGHKRNVRPEDECPKLVDECVRIAFAGNWNEFEEWAMDYAEYGCGVSG